MWIGSESRRDDRHQHRREQEGDCCERGDDQDHEVDHRRDEPARSLILAASDQFRCDGNQSRSDRSGGDKLKERVGNPESLDECIEVGALGAELSREHCRPAPTEDPRHHDPQHHDHRGHGDGPTAQAPHRTGRQVGRRGIGRQDDVAAEIGAGQGRGCRWDLERHAGHERDVLLVVRSEGRR